MSISQTVRAQKIAEEFNRAESSWLNLVSQMTSQVTKTEQLTAWLHDNHLKNLGDVSEDDRASFRNEFQQQLDLIQSLVDRLQACKDVYDPTDAVRQANLDAFVAATSVNIADVEARF